MSGTSLLPSLFNPSSVARFPQGFDPFLMLRRNMDRMLDDLLSGNAPAAARGGQAPAMMLSPQIDISETEREVRITAEMPGMNADDVEVRLDDGVLTIHGEKRAEQQDDKQDYHLMERSYGTFSRYIRLPFSIGPDQVQATFKDGVLTITIPKPDDAQRKSNKIDVKKDDSSTAPSSQATAPPGETGQASTAANPDASQAAAE
jgi:HSP20 family protein